MRREPTNHIDVTSADSGTFGAYVARPDERSGPALVLLQEIFGVNDFMRAQADMFAAEGYVAIVPDLFWRIKPNIELSYSDEDFSRAMELGRAINLDKAVEDIQATITHARSMDGVAGQVGVLGYCLGERLAFLAAARIDTAVAVSYYGVGIDTHLEELDRITCPLVLHFPSEDRFCPPEAQKKVFDAIQGKDNVWFYTYQGQDHGFAATGREHYHKASANVALSRSLQAIKREMGPIYRYEDLWDRHCALEFEHRDVDTTMTTMVANPM